MLFLSGYRNQPDLTSDEADELAAVLVFTKRHDPSEGQEAATCSELGSVTTSSLSSIRSLKTLPPPEIPSGVACRLGAPSLASPLSRLEDVGGNVRRVGD
jgi:hypothetical protein